MKPQSCFKIAGLSVLITLSGCASVGHYIGVGVGLFITAYILLAFMGFCEGIGGKFGLLFGVFLTCWLIYYSIQDGTCTEIFRDPDEAAEERRKESLDRIEKDPLFQKMNRDRMRKHREFCNRMPWECPDLHKKWNNLE